MSSLLVQLVALFAVLFLNCVVLQGKSEYSHFYSFAAGTRMSLGLVIWFLFIDRIKIRFLYTQPVLKDDEFGSAINRASIRQTAIVGIFIMLARLSIVPINVDRILYEMGYCSGLMLAVLASQRPATRKPRRKRRTSSLLETFRNLVRSWQRAPVRTV